MKVTFLSPNLNMGGGTKVVAIYADYLTKKGHDVLVVSHPERKSGFISQLIKIYRIRNAQQLKNVFAGFPWFDKKQKSHFDGSDVKQHVIDKYRPIVDSDLPDSDVIIATWWETAEWLEKIDKKKDKKLYFIKGHEVFDYITKDRAIATYKTQMQKITISKWLKNILETEYESVNVDLVYNAIDKHNFYYKKREKQKVPTIGFLISDSYIKGVDVALKVVSLLKEMHPDIRVLTFGSSISENLLLDENYVSFKSLPTQNEIKEIYSSCDVWLASTRSEGFNLTAMEAMACGTPVVSTKTGWPNEILNDYQNGILTDIDDLEALTNGVAWILAQNNHDWVKISRAAAAATEPYSWESSALKFEEILQRVSNASDYH